MGKKSLADLYRDPLEDREPPAPRYVPPPRGYEPTGRPPLVPVMLCFGLILSGLGLRFAPKFACPSERHSTSFRAETRTEGERLAERVDALREFEREHGHFPAARARGDEEMAELCGWLGEGAVTYRTTCRPAWVRLSNELEVSGWLCLEHAGHTASLETDVAKITLRPATRR